MKQVFILLIILQSLITSGQKWDHIYGDYNTNEFFEDVIECYDKGYLISGGNDVVVYPNLLIKTDINGEVLWEKTIQHDQNDILKGAISQNSSGELVVARTMWVSGNDNWPSITKLDACGNKLWCKVFIDDNFMWGAFEDVILFDNGDVLALGNLEADGNYVDQIFLYYIESDGTLLWRKSYASQNDHPLVKPRVGKGIHKFESEYIISGWCYYPYPENPNTGYIRPFFIAIDSLFNEKWILPFGVNDYIYGEAHNLIPLSDSVYMGVGARFLEGYEQNSLLMFFNSEGEELGFSQITNDAIGPDMEDNITVDIARINDTLFITSTVFGPDESLATYGEFIIDTAANIYKIESRPNTEGISTLIKTFDGKYVIGCTYEHSNSNEDIYLYKINDSLEFDTVYTANYTYDSLCPYQIESGTIDISDCLLITDVGETPSPEEYYANLNIITVKAFPNPTNGSEITFEYQNTEHHKDMELRCFNVFGDEVHSEKVYPYQGKSKVDVQNWKSGIYVALVYSNGKVVGRTKFVVHR